MAGLWRSWRRFGIRCCISRAEPVRLQLEALEDRTLLSASAFVRVDQVGYASGSPMQALLMASGPESGATFSVRSGTVAKYTAPIGANQGIWSSAFPDVYLLDFSAAGLPAGSYSIAVSGPIPAQSPPFRIAAVAALDSALLPNALFFYHAQRDGPSQDIIPSVMGRQPSHTTDSQAFIYQTPAYDSNDSLTHNLVRISSKTIDVSGGWFDAGDYLKFVETASYTDAVLLLAARDDAAATSAGSPNLIDEALYGLDWLLKMWDDKTKTLYYQVGLGDGNNGNFSPNIMGDHDVWRLPEQDDALNIPVGDRTNSEYYVKYRPVFRAGTPESLISPNLAGRLAADFAMGFQVQWARNDRSDALQSLQAAADVFRLAKIANVGQLTTTAPFDFYPEQVWQDDMELGAAELYLATAEAKAAGVLPPGVSDPSFYLQKAAHWANSYITAADWAHAIANGGPANNADSLNLYDVSGLAHYELYRAILQAGNARNLEVTPAGLLADLKNQLLFGKNQAGHDPFGLGLSYSQGNGDLVPHALGYALEAGLYDELANTSTFAAFGHTQLDWVLGENAWGTTFISGTGRVYPHCLHDQIANLYVPPGGTWATMYGAVVDGPSDMKVLNSLAFPADLPDSPDQPRQCGSKTQAGNPLRAFNGLQVIYWDDVVAWPSVEPADDYTALTVLVFARQVTGRPQVTPVPDFAALTTALGTAAVPAPIWAAAPAGSDTGAAGTQEPQLPAAARAEVRSAAIRSALAKAAAGRRQVYAGTPRPSRQHPNPDLLDRILADLSDGLNTTVA